MESAVVAEEQLGLFGDLPIPEKSGEPYQSVYVHFETLEDLQAFGRLLDLPLTTQTRVLRFPIQRLAGVPAQPVVEDPIADVPGLLEEAETYFLSVAPILSQDAAESRDLVRRLASALEFLWGSRNAGGES